MILSLGIDSTEKVVHVGCSIGSTPTKLKDRCTHCTGGLK
jgi:hypothetical protein